MPSLIAHLSKADRTRFLKNLNYLNVKEYQGFCDKHGIPYVIHIETKTGLRKTSDKDRKKVVLQKIRYYLNTGKIPGPTVFPGKVVHLSKSDLTSSTRIHFGQYDKKNRKFIQFIKSLTHGAFKNGMIARVVLRDFWANGIAPTLGQFAEAWMLAEKNNPKYHPEAAYLSDLNGWKSISGLERTPH